MGISLEIFPPSEIHYEFTVFDLWTIYCIMLGLGYAPWTFTQVSVMHIGGLDEAGI